MDAEFDCGFIQAACEMCDFDDFDNERIDTLVLAKKRIPSASSYGLGGLGSPAAPSQ